MIFININYYPNLDLSTIILHKTSKIIIKMIKIFALTLSEIGIGKLEIFVIGIVSLLFPILFIIASRNLDAKGVFDWMMEKPNDWIGKK